MKFRKVKCPTYESSPLHGEADIIHAMDILIEERISKLSTMIRKSISDFHAQLKHILQNLQRELNELLQKQTTDL